MPPQAPWSPTAHAFAHHQFSHVANFWKQGRQASFRLEALPCGQAELNLTFQLPAASEVIPPPSHVFPASAPQPQRPIPPLFPNGFFPPKVWWFSLQTCFPKENLFKAAQKLQALSAPQSCLGCALSSPSQEWIPTTGCSSLRKTPAG